MPAMRFYLIYLIIYLSIVNKITDLLKSYRSLTARMQQHPIWKGAPSVGLQNELGILDKGARRDGLTCRCVKCPGAFGPFGRLDSARPGHGVDWGWQVSFVPIVVAGAGTRDVRRCTIDVRGNVSGE